MEKLRYHTLWKPRKLKNGKTVHRWYYYWVDETGREIQRSCGTAVKSRQAAEDYIRTLPPPLQRPGMRLATHQWALGSTPTCLSAT